MSVFSVYVTQGLHGMVYGMLLFLVSSGLTLVFGMMGILNIAHAAFYMLGAFLFIARSALFQFHKCSIRPPSSFMGKKLLTDLHL